MPLGSPFRSFHRKRYTNVTAEQTEQIKRDISLRSPLFPSSNAIVTAGVIRMICN